MKPLLAVVTDINVMIGNVFFLPTKRHPRLVVPAHILGILVTLFVTTPGIATSVVALLDRRNHQIVIAADSLERIQYSGRTQKRCKIIEVPRCAFGMAGMFNKPHPHFDLEALARRACGIQGDLRRKSDSFIEIAKPAVVKLVQYLHDKEPRYYVERVANGKADFIEVLFAGTDGGYLSIFARGFRVDSNGLIIPITDDVTESNPQSGVGFFGGTNSTILSYIRSHNEWEQLGYARAAQAFVQLEIDAEAEDVGPPISVLQIDRLGGTHWPDHGVCTCGQPKPRSQQAQKRR